MQSIRRSLSFAGLSLMAMALTFAACTDDGQSPVGPEPLPPTQPPLQTVAIECKASIKSLGMKCEVPRGSAGAASGVILAEQRVDVELTSNDLVVTADTFAFDVNVRNVFPQPTSGPRQLLGKDSLGVEHPIQVFVHYGPLAPKGGSVEVVNESGMGTFTNGNQPYFEYPVVLDSGEVSPDVRWKLRFSPEVDSLTFKVMVSAALPRPTGWVDVSPDTALVPVSGTTTMTGVARNHAGQVTGQAITWSSSDPAVATVDPNTGVVTGLTKGTAIITASTPTPGRYGTAVVIVSATPSVVTANYNAIENVTATVDSAAGLMTAVTDDGDARITPGIFATAAGGSVVVESSGAFLYIGKAGYSGPDSFNFTVVDGVSSINGLANVTVAPSHYWFVRAGATEAMDGTQAGPFPTVAAAQAAAVGPDAADSIFVLNAGATQLDGPVVLEAGQALIGEGISKALVVALNGAVDTIVGNAGEPILTRTTAGATVTLATNNVLRGLGITAANGAAITGNGFGTLKVRETRLNPAGPALHLTSGTLDLDSALVSSTGSGTDGLFLSGVAGTLDADSGTIQNAAGRLVHIQNGTVTLTYPGAIRGTGEGISLTGNTGGAVTFSGELGLTRKGIVAQNNTGGTFSFTGAKTIDVDSTTYAGVSLATNAGATFVFGGGNLAISTATGTGFSATGGGTVRVEGAGNSISTGNGTAVSLGGANTTVELDSLNVTATGTAAAFSAFGSASVTVTDVAVNATGGPALSVVSSTLNGTFSDLTSMTSASSAVILNDAAGAFVAAAGTLSGGAGGPTIAVIGGSVTFFDFGTVSQAANAPLLSVTPTATTPHTGDLNFNGTVSASAGTGLRFDNADGNYFFNGVTTLTGGDAGVSVIGGSGGTFTFANATIAPTNPTGVPLNVAASAPVLTITAGTITQNSGRAVAVNGLTGGSVSVAAAVNSGAPGGTGILVQGNTGGTTEFIGGGTLSTGTANAVTLSGNDPAATIRFAGPALTITTTTGTGFNADGTGGAGTLVVTGVGKKVRSTGGTAIRILNTKIDGTSGAVFDSVSAAGGANGIVLQNTNTGVFGVNAGSIAGTTGAGVQLTNTAFVTLNNLTVSAGTTGAAIAGSTFGTLTVDNTKVTAGAAPALALSGGTVNGTFAEVGGTVAGASKGVSLTAVNGSFNVSTGILTAGLDSAMVVRGGTVTANWGGSVTQANNFPLLAVTGTHQTGALTFSGPLTATGGTGLQFSDADGTYSFSGNVSLNGGDAGIDIVGGSGGNFGFGQNVSVGAVTSPSGTAFAVNASSPNVVFSGDLRKTNAGLLVDVTNQSLVGTTMTFQTGTIQATAGDGIQLSGVNGTTSFTGTVTLNGGNAGVDVIGGSTGTISFVPAAGETQTITNPSGEVIRVLNSSPAFTYAGSFTKNSTGSGILVQGSGGTVKISGAGVTKSLATSTSNAVNLLNNSGTISFEGGGLVLGTTTGTGFNATGSGTVNVTGTGNIVSSSGGVGVNIQNVDVGASNVEFRSVTATGASNGIVLVNTGSTGGSFKVIGNNAAGTGGEIQVTSGADGGVAGNGVYLQNARNVSLDWINFTGSVNHAVRGVDAANFTMHKARVTGTHGNNAAIDESAVFFSNLSGTASITGSNISGSIEDNLRFVNNTGTLNRLVLDGDTVGPHDTAEGNDGVYIESGGSAVLNATIQNSRFTSARGDWLNVNVVTTGKADLVFTGNTLTNNHPNILGGGGGTTIAVGGTATLTYSITNNSFRDSKGSAIVLFKGFGGGAGTGTMSGTVSGNIIGVNGVANSASTEGSGIAVTELARGTHTVRIHGNQIRGYNNHGILLTAGGAATSSTGLPAHDGVLNATITGNTIGQPGNLASIAAGKNGVHLNAGTNSPDAYNVCLKLGGAGAGEANSITGSGSAEVGVTTATDFRLRNRILTTVRLPGYAGANNNDAAVTSYVQGRNPVSPTGNVTNNVVGGGPGFVGGADCTLP